MSNFSVDLTHTIVMIDGANNNHACRSAGVQLDWKKVRDDLFLTFSPRRYYYYTATQSAENGFIAIQGLIDWLDFNGYTVVQKAAKEYEKADGSIRTKGDMDMEIAVDAMVASAYADHIILFTGDGDFCYLVHELKKRGVCVTVVSTLAGSVLSTDLRRAADNFIDVMEMRHWWRDERVPVQAVQEPEPEPQEQTDISPRDVVRPFNIFGKGPDGAGD